MPERKVTKLSVDMTNVPDRREGGRAAHVPEGDYVLKVRDASFVPVASGANQGKHQALWVLDIVKPAKHKSAGSIWHRTGIWPEAVWAFRNFLQDLKGGAELPKKAVNVDLSRYIGAEIGATLVDGEPYGKPGQEKRVKSEISQTFPASKYSEGEESTEDEADESDDEEEIETSDDDDEADEIDEDDL